MNNTTSLFITDPLNDLNPKKDTTILWMQEISAQGGQVFQCEMSDLIYSDGLTQAMASEIPDTLSQPQTANASDGLIPLNEFNYVFMRKDPPVDENYMNALHLLSQAKHEGAKVMNDPDALKIFNEKVFALRFSQWMPDTQVICREDDLLNFKNKYQTIILKPLDGMGGESIYKFEEITAEHLKIFKDLTNNYQTMVMVQNFLPEIYEGDYRILIINGKPFPMTLARIPQGNNFKGNLAAGGKGEARPLNPKQQEVGEAIGDLLLAEGITFAGIDMIGDFLTEINVTSPTGAREILEQTQQKSNTGTLRILLAMQPLIYKQRMQRWGFRKSFFVSIGFHCFVLFGISFAVIQQPWQFQEETIVNVKFANAAFDMKGQSFGDEVISERNIKLGALIAQDVTLQNDSQFSVRRLESNSSLESFEAVYLNAWQRKIETAGYYEIADSKIIQGSFRVQIKSVIDAQGNLLAAEILQSSGNSAVDAMALRILRNSSPFQPFPGDMLSRYSQLEIVRDWNFTSS